MNDRLKTLLFLFWMTRAQTIAGFTPNSAHAYKLHVAGGGGKMAGE